MLTAPGAEALDEGGAHAAEGGDGGGEVVAAGTPEDVAKTARSYTGQYLKPMLKAPLKALKAG